MTCFSHIFHLFLRLQSLTKIDMTNMTAKVQIKNDTINSFGGIFFAIDQFRASRLAKLVNNTLGSKGLNARFKFSDTLENMASIFLSGGEVLEDVNFFRTFYIRAMGCQKLEKRIAAVHQPSLRQASFIKRAFLTVSSLSHSLGWGDLYPQPSKTPLRRPRNRTCRPTTPLPRGLEAPAGGYEGVFAEIRR